jgi:large conductance mechanosensitive channel
MYRLKRSFMSLAEDFKKFILRGNVVDLAVGVIIGAAFGKIVSSLVADVVMPPLGLLVGGVNFTDLKVELSAAAVDAAGKAIPAVTLNYGSFLQTVFDFLVVASAVFVMIQALTRLQKKKEEAPAAPAAPPAQEVLLAEIRDLLKKK